MFKTAKTAAITAVTALSIAITAAAPAHALGKNERNFLKGVAATVIIGALINDAQARQPQPQPVYRPQPQPQPQYRPHPQPQPQHHYRPRQDHHHSTSGRVIGSNASVHSTIAAQSFNSYSVAQRRAIQSRLRAFGYYNGGIDAAFGPGTYNAVVAYARDSGGERQLQTRAGTFGIYDSLIY
ncbi:MAG: peptidoglycan-binding domain-containing protein [Pseudotabrizicola sp.]|uniref:peptidoglycan-binding domain-containing protein n=1 Tax=Pseudotabrizicola sp. TaxID=2939647 RepID=UPI00271EE550|nr:peptidoglycan-binding domain-containing protein [Pseudotabrizicola sp.]MDO8882336.1 peptidoglycan-binding domain-containing protein [Pseudotabrizicola sp.]MDP2081699.1 peptidoglycan-binding domain-containing protein [Pseudotabrizicola sp.]MDZ7574049.1 peptidoglycan-binding domain-containing protein [Pseudotabrizicola sp.]